MTKESLAALLNGREYRKFDLTKEEAEQARCAGLVAVFGYSDDNLEFRGAVNDEVGAYDGATALLYKHTGKVSAVPCESEVIREIEDDFKLYKALGAMMDRHNLVEAIWGPQDLNASWLIKSALPHAPFDIVEDGELFCRGLVLDVADLK